jgi:hypothetical protein
MANYEAKIIGAEEFKKALERNPELVISELKKFIQRALAKYKSGIINSPWAVGLNGGGAPVLTGNLRDTHLTEINNFQGRIFPNANYAGYVHKNRPWLDYVFENKMTDVEVLEQDFADVIIKDLAK